MAAAFVSTAMSTLRRWAGFLMFWAADDPGSQRCVGDPARGVDAACITMQKQRRHHPRIERRLTEPARVTPVDRAKIKLLPDQRQDQPRQVVLRHVILH